MKKAGNDEGLSDSVTDFSSDGRSRKPVEHPHLENGAPIETVVFPHQSSGSIRTTGSTTLSQRFPFSKWETPAHASDDASSDPRANSVGTSAQRTGTLQERTLQSCDSTSSVASFSALRNDSLDSSSSLILAPNFTGRNPVQTSHIDKIGGLMLSDSAQENSQEIHDPDMTPKPRLINPFEHPLRVVDDFRRMSREELVSPTQSLTDVEALSSPNKYNPRDSDVSSCEIVGRRNRENRLTEDGKGYWDYSIIRGGETTPPNPDLMSFDKNPFRSPASHNESGSTHARMTSSHKAVPSSPLRNCTAFEDVAEPSDLRHARTSYSSTRRLLEYGRHILSSPKRLFSPKEQPIALAGEEDTPRLGAIEFGRNSSTYSRSSLYTNSEAGEILGLGMSDTGFLTSSSLLSLSESQQKGSEAGETVLPQHEQALRTTQERIRSLLAAVASPPSPHSPSMRGHDTGDSISQVS